MKVSIISTYDVSGGAARAAHRLYKGLQAKGIALKMLVQSKVIEDYNIIGPPSNLAKSISFLRPTLDSLPLRFYRSRQPIIFSPGILPDRLTKKIAEINPDIIHLHWIAGGFMRIESLMHFNKPIVWTLHDSWAFTGGCHLPFDCIRYQDSCGACPILNSHKETDFSRKIWLRKRKALKGLDITIVTPSRWLGDCAKTSSLLRNRQILTIPNGLNTTCFKPIDKATARNILSLPKDKKLILFGSMDITTNKLKGFHLLADALRSFANYRWRNIAELIVIGACEPSTPPDLGLKYTYFGHINDEISMAILYSAVDVFVLPSIHENLPNVIMEAMACGTPCVAFNIGGISDLIEHKKTGYLAQSFDTEDMANGIAWILDKTDRWQQLSQHARSKVENEFALEKVAQRYVELYNKILAK